MKQQSNKKSLELQNFRAFGKYTHLLLLSTHLCKNLLKSLNIANSLFHSIVMFVVDDQFCTYCTLINIKM